MPFIRYHTDPSIRPLLPGWIAAQVVPQEQVPDFGKAFVVLNRFFKGKAMEN